MIRTRGRSGTVVTEPRPARVAWRYTQLGGLPMPVARDLSTGIPDHDRERVWQRFVRLDRDRETHAAGAGVGLSVVRDLVLLHRGRASIEEGAKGGCRFVVSVPLGDGE